MGGMVSQGISKAGQPVLVRFMESQIQHLPAGSVALYGEGSEIGQELLLTLQSGRKLSSSSHLDAGYFSASLYAAGAFKAATLVLVLRESASLGLQKFLPLTQSPLVFAARSYSYGELSSWHSNLWLWGLCGAATPHSQDIPSKFLSTTCG